MPHESSSTGVKTCASIPTPVAGCAMRFTTPQTHVAPRHPSTFETLSHHIFHVLLPSYISLKIAIHCDFISKLSPSNYINYINFFQLYRLLEPLMSQQDMDQGGQLQGASRGDCSTTRIRTVATVCTPKPPAHPQSRVT